MLTYKNKIITTCKSLIVFILIACTIHDRSANTAANSNRLGISQNEYDSTIFEEAFHKLYNDGILPQETIDSFSNTIDTRADFYDILSKFDKQSLFPKELISFEKATESRLASWLLFPTELGAVPSQIELIKKVDHLKNDTTFTYYVYKFRIDEPHWAAKDGWMIGVVGPYFRYSQPYDFPKGTFSKFSKIGETTPEQEVTWVHENIFKE